MAGGVNFQLTADIAFGDGRGLRDFFLAHRLAHDEIDSAIVAAYGVQVPAFQIDDERAMSAWELAMLQDDVPEQASEAIQAWLYLHARLHSAEYQAAGQDFAINLSTVDFSDRRQFGAWMLDHQQAHSVIADFLGINQ